MTASGVCVPAWNEGCFSDWDCPPGQVCELQTQPGCDPATGICDPLIEPPGICVDDGNVECVSDEDCLDGDAWHARCIEGRCEYVEQFCMADSDCGPGFACELVDCLDPDPNGTDCAGFPGICVPADGTNP